MFDTSSLDVRLQDWLAVNKDQIISKVLFNSKASERFNLQTQVVNDTAIVRLDVTAPLQDGSQCGFTASGTDTFSNRMLQPVTVAVMKEYCPKDLLKSWAATEVAVTAGRETMPFEEKVLTLIAEQVNKNVEHLLMEGNSNNGDLTEGLLTKIDAEITSGVIPAANDLAKGSDDILTRCQKLFQACPPELLGRAEIWMSIGNYKQLLIDLVNANLYNIYETMSDANDYSMVLPGTTLVIRGIDSITQDVILLFDPLSVYKGVDLANGQEEFDMWYDRSSQTFKLNICFKIAINYIFPEEMFVNR